MKIDLCDGDDVCVPLVKISSREFETCSTLNFEITEGAESDY